MAGTKPAVNKQRLVELLSEIAISQIWLTKLMGAAIGCHIGSALGTDDRTVRIPSWGPNDR